MGFVIEMRENRSRFWVRESLYFFGLFNFGSLKVNPLPHTIFLFPNYGVFLMELNELAQLVMPVTCIGEVFVWNVGWGTVCPD
jgi:hypothetical protein